MAYCNIGANKNAHATNWLINNKLAHHHTHTHRFSSVCAYQECKACSLFDKPVNGVSLVSACCFVDDRICLFLHKGERKRWRYSVWRSDSILHTVTISLSLLAKKKLSHLSGESLAWPSGQRRRGGGGGGGYRAQCSWPYSARALHSLGFSLCNNLNLSKWLYHIINPPSYYKEVSMKSATKRGQRRQERRLNIELLSTTDFCRASLERRSQRVRQTRNKRN